MTFTGNEMFPRTNILLGLASFIIILSYVVNGNLFGQMAVIIRTINKKGQLHSKIVDLNHSIMEKIKLPRDLSNEIKTYHYNSVGKQEYQNELKTFLSMISPGLKLKV
jgi:hypothetical protein